MAYRPDELADFVENTLRQFDKGWTDISLSHQKYFVMSQLLLDDYVQFDGGERLQWQVKVENGNEARATGLYDIDDSSVIDHTVNANVPWAMQETKFSYDERESVFQGGNATKIIDLVRLRRHSALCSFAELMEDLFWQAYAAPSSGRDRLKPYSLLYYIVFNATKGFNGGAPAGHTTVAGLNPTTYPRWKNWTDTYTTISKPDMIRAMRTAVYETGFENPIPHPTTERGSNTRVRNGSGIPKSSICTTWEVKMIAEEILEGQNDNLGRELSWGGESGVLFKGSEVQAIPWLDKNNGSGFDYPANPIIGLNLSTFYPVFQSGEYMSWQKPQRAANQRRVWVTAMDNTCQIKCTDRRANWAIYQA